MKNIILNLFALVFILSLISCNEQQKKPKEGLIQVPVVTSLEISDETTLKEKFGDEYEQGKIEAEKNPKGKSPQFTFESIIYDFGKIEQGEKVQHTFNFENTGTAPLIISNIKTTCGCTTPKWTKDPIPVGEKGTIEVEFNSNGKSNKQTKPITIFSNTGKPTVITLIGFVNVNRIDGPMKEK